MVQIRFSPPGCVTRTPPTGGGDPIITSTGYDAAGNVVAQTDGNGNVTVYQYDDANRLIAVVQPLPDEVATVHPTTTYTYDANGNQTSVTDPLGHTTFYVYDGLNRQIEVDLGTQTLATTTYDLAGNVLTSTQYLDAATSRTTTNTYDDFGELVSSYSPQGLSTFSYDNMGRLILAVGPDPDAGPTDTPVAPSFAYNYDELSGMPLSVTSDLGTSYTYYNDLGRLIESIDAGGNITIYTYDASRSDDRPASVLKSNMDFTAYVYDGLGRTTESFYVFNAYLPSLSSTGGMATYYTYDADGNVLTQTDPNGNETINTYDYFNRLTSTTQVIGVADTAEDRPEDDPDDQTTTYTYDANSNRLTLTDPDGNTTTWTYDNLNRMTSETNELDHARSYQYDDAGNLVQLTDRNGRVTKYQYDDLNRQTEEDWLDGDTVVYAIAYDYDLAGRLLSVTSPDSTYTYTYDTHDRVETVDNAGTPNVPEVLLTYSYDAYGRNTGVSAAIADPLTPDELTPDFLNAYEYDAIGQLTQVTQTGQEDGNAVADKRVDLNYFTPGRVNGITRYGSLTTDNFVLSAGYTYGEYPGGFFDDPTGNLTAMTYTALAPNYLGFWQPTTVVQYNWTYDAGGRVHTFYSEGDATFSSNGTDTATYTYDQTNQLVGVTHTNTDLASEDFSYDPNGNRTNDDNTPGTNNELQSDGTYNYTYDNEGNRIERDRITPIEGALDNITLYAWDYRDRLTSVTMKSDSDTVVRTVNYTYDTNNLRIGETVVDATAGTSVTDFVYDGTNVALDFTADDTTDLPALARRYLYGQAVDQLLAQEDYDPTTDRVVDDLWQLTDNQGTVRDVIKTEDGSTVLSEQQQITFATVPVGGTWTITTVAGTTDPLAYNASLSTIQAALDATTDNPGDIVVTGGYAHGFTLTYSGSCYAGLNVDQATMDDSNLTMPTLEEPEVEETGNITLPSDLVGTWTGDDNSVSTIYLVGDTLWVSTHGIYTPLSWEDSTTVDVVYYGSYAVITHDGAELDWYNWYGSTFAGSWFKTTGLGNETQQITFSVVPIGGTWTITTVAGTTAPIAYNASLASIQDALDAITPHAHDIVITGDYSSGFLLTYLGTSYAQSDVSQASVDESALTRATDDEPEVDESTDGGAGSIDLVGNWNMNGNDANSFYTVGGALWVFIVPTYWSPVTWIDNHTISTWYGSAVISHDGAELDWVNGTPYADPWYRTEGLGNETQQIRFDDVPTSGTWTITTLAGTTASLSYDAAAWQIQDALDAITTFPHDIVITGDYANGFLLTYLGTSYAHTNISQATVNDYTEFDATVTTLDDGYAGSYTHEVQTITLPAGLNGGTWQIDDGGALDYNATTATVESYLDSLLGQTVTVSGDAGGPYTITWANLGWQSLLTVANIDLQHADAASVSTVDEGGAYYAHAVQVLTLPGSVIGGTWQINGGAPLDWNVDSTTLASYLDSTLGKTVTVTGDPGGPYTVLWADVGQQDLLTVANIDFAVVDDSATLATLRDGGTTFHAHMAYSAFGNLLSAVDSDGNPIDITTLTRYLYTSREFDPATGLQYNDHRWLDQRTGGWISIDPASFIAGDGNLYRYVNNGPTDAIDPSGLRKQVFAFEGYGGFPRNANGTYITPGADTRPKYDAGGQLIVQWGRTSRSQVVNYLYRAVAAAGRDVVWHYYAADHVAEAVSDIRRIATRPTSSTALPGNFGTCAQYDTIVLLGYSNGAAAAFEVARKLYDSYEIQVDLALTIDPVRRPLDGALLGVSGRLKDTSQRRFKGYQLD